jgi:hypothetical protein
MLTAKAGTFALPRCDHKKEHALRRDFAAGHL